MDTVFIRGLAVETVIGIHPWEKHAPRPLVLDLELGSDCARAAASDRIEDTVDYDAVSRRLAAFVRDGRWELVETLAERCAALLRMEFGVPWLRLTVHKPGALGEGVDVGVTIERGARRSAGVP